MARPLRIEFAGALYHITSRGNEQKAIFQDDTDRNAFLTILEEAVGRHGWRCYAYCLMTNHYHLLIETPHCQLSKGMRHLNGVYAQRFNQRHDRVGHLFQGRYKAPLVEKEAYLLELARYIVLNPVRAGIVQHVAAWPWSSYQTTCGMTNAAEWMAIESLLAHFGSGQKPSTKAYAGFVAQGRLQSSPWRGLKNHTYLGSDRFIEKIQDQLKGSPPLRDVPKIQQRPPPKLLDFYVQHSDSDKSAMAEAYSSAHFTLDQIADHFGVSRMTVSRAYKAFVKCET